MSSFDQDFLVNKRMVICPEQNRKEKEHSSASNKMICFKLNVFSRDIFHELAVSEPHSVRGTD